MAPIDVLLIVIVPLALAVYVFKQVWSKFRPRVGDMANTAASRWERRIKNSRAGQQGRKLWRWTAHAAGDTLVMLWPRGVLLVCGLTLLQFLGRLSNRIIKAVLEIDFNPYARVPQSTTIIPSPSFRFNPEGSHRVVHWYQFWPDMQARFVPDAIFTNQFYSFANAVSLVIALVALIVFFRNLTRRNRGDQILPQWVLALTAATFALAFGHGLYLDHIIYSCMVTGRCDFSQATIFLALACMALIVPITMSCTLFVAEKIRARETLTGPAPQGRIASALPGLAAFSLLWTGVGILLSELLMFSPIVSNPSLAFAFHSINFFSFCCFLAVVAGLFFMLVPYYVCFHGCGFWEALGKNVRFTTSNKLLMLGLFMVLAATRLIPFLISQIAQNLRLYSGLYLGYWLVPFIEILWRAFVVMFIYDFFLTFIPRTAPPAMDA